MKVPCLETFADAAFAFATLPITMPILGSYFGRKQQELLKVG